MDNTRNELIRQMLDTFDTIDALRYDNRVLRERLSVVKKGAPEAKRYADIDEHVLEVGRKETVKQALDYWHSVRYSESDSGEVEIETFDKWRERVVERRKIPDWCCWDSFIEYFFVELRDIYDKEREKAVAELNGTD